MFLTAHVLLPEGFDAHPDARFPIMITHDHFRGDFPGFRTTPPDPSSTPTFQTFSRQRLQSHRAARSIRVLQRWIARDFPRFLVVYIDHPNPYYDDSYGVDSANLGPYGRAIHSELIPEIERRFRAIGQGWARFTYGGSTGGWEALAAQVANPDFYNGAFAACPDPIDFRGMTNFDIYEIRQRLLPGRPISANFTTRSTRRKRPHTLELKSNNDLESALGSHGRSGEQWDIWFSVFGPVGRDGYPKPLFDRETGVIDREVAQYWREHSDLSAIVQRNWPCSGPSCAGRFISTSARRTHFFSPTACTTSQTC